MLTVDRTRGLVRLPDAQLLESLPLVIAAMRQQSCPHIASHT